MSTDKAWMQAFAEAIHDVGDGMDYRTAADRLRQLLATGLLGLADITERPERFFLAHRMLAAHATRFGPGFWIRFTVHFNLFAGTVVALGTPEQLAALVKRNAQRPRLGCFGLTECLAGVHSGLVVDTRAELSADGQTIDLHSPTQGSRKTWISQGLVADEAVVIATLYVKGRSYGPQAFLVTMREPVRGNTSSSSEGTLVPGISVVDMGRKTVGNDLDNAQLAFDHVKLPISALLSRYTQIGQNGDVKMPSGPGLRTMDMIGQRLFTGRVCVAQAAIEFARTLFKTTQAFADNKPCWAPKGKRHALSAVPQIAHIFAKGTRDIERLSGYLSKLEAELCACLRSGTLPPLRLQQAIAVAKVSALEDTIALCFGLKQEVGSYALMAGTGFEQLDFLQCCKFAEGDSRILMQKMARDLVRQDGKPSPQGWPLQPREKQALANLQQRLQHLTSSSVMTHAEAWDASWRLVYDLAQQHMLSIMVDHYGCSMTNDDADATTSSRL